MKEYRIKTVEDIVKKVPTDKLDNFLKDLKNFVIVRKAVVDVNKLFKTEIKTEKGMLWIDDGKHDMKFNCTITDK
jgi:hypothetical protein